MENDEIRYKIAVLKGWTRESYNNAIEFDIPNGHNKWLLDWPVNISDAWELVEEMYNYNIKKIGGVVTAVLYPDTHILRGQVGKADTAPVAICLAYIGVKESQNA